MIAIFSVEMAVPVEYPYLNRTTSDPAFEIFEDYQEFKQEEMLANETQARMSEIANLPHGVTVAMAILFTGYMLTGIFGNMLTITALLRCTRVRNVTAAFIVSLCVADLLFCVLVMPWEVSRFMLRKWVWGEGAVCNISPLLRYWNVAASLLSIAMITINRYIMIAHNSCYNAIYKPLWVGLMVAFCWLFPFAMLLPILLGKWGRFGLNERLDTCTIIPMGGLDPKKSLFVIAFSVPAAIIVLCYSLIFCAIRRSRKRVEIHRASSPHDGSPSSTDMRRRKQELRITQMVLTIFLAFLITYLPITLVKTYDSYIRHPGLHMVGYVLIYISCFINPIIYVIMNRQYRQAYKTVLTCSHGSRNRLASVTVRHSAGDGKSNRVAHGRPSKVLEPPEKTIVCTVSENNTSESTASRRTDHLPLASSKL